MKILFSPSESKDASACIMPKFGEDSFIFKELFSLRQEALNAYESFVKIANDEELSKLFGIKDLSLIKAYKQDLKEAKTARAIDLYNGVSYEHLGFSKLDLSAQNYILKNVLIFSNLFGVVRACDTLPFYKLKQGVKLANFELEKFYKTHFSKVLDEYLKDEELLDLRAGFYDKFYTPNKKYFTYKFLKNGKIVSHFAKAYRGILLKTLALKNIKTNTELLANLPPNLSLKEIKIIGKKEEITLEIC